MPALISVWYVLSNRNWKMFCWTKKTKLA